MSDKKYYTKFGYKLYLIEGTTPQTKGLFRIYTEDISFHNEHELSSSSWESKSDTQHELDKIAIQEDLLQIPTHRK